MKSIGAQIAALGALSFLTYQLPDAAERLGVPFEDAPMAIVVNVVRLRFPDLESELDEVCEIVLSAYTYVFQLGPDPKRDPGGVVAAFGFIRSTWDLESVAPLASEDAGYLCMRLVIPLVAECRSLVNVAREVGDIVSLGPLPPGWEPEPHRSHAPATAAPVAADRPSVQPARASSESDRADRVLVHLTGGALGFEGPDQLNVDLCLAFGVTLRNNLHDEAGVDLPSQAASAAVIAAGFRAAVPIASSTCGLALFDDPAPKALIESAAARAGLDLPLLEALDHDSNRYLARLAQALRNTLAARGVELREDVLPELPGKLAASGSFLEKTSADLGIA